VGRVTTVPQPSSRNDGSLVVARPTSSRAAHGGRCKLLAALDSLLQPTPGCCQMPVVTKSSRTINREGRHILKVIKSSRTPNPRSRQILKDAKSSRTPNPRGRQLSITPYPRGHQMRAVDNTEDAKSSKPRNTKKKGKIRG